MIFGTHPYFHLTHDRSEKRLSHQQKEKNEKTVRGNLFCQPSTSTTKVVE
jgi:hypothetical protein